MLHGTSSHFYKKDGADAWAREAGRLTSRSRAHGQEATHGSFAGSQFRAMRMGAHVRACTTRSVGWTLGPGALGDE
jgi:hypothetical protein